MTSLIFPTPISRALLRPISTLTALVSLVALTTLAPANLLAQVVDESESPLAAADSLELAAELQDSINISQLPRHPVDSLLSDWYSRPLVTINDFVPDTVALADAVIGGVPDSVYVERLQSMMSPIPMTYNDQVRRFIELYVVRRRDLVQRMLSLANYYFPIFDQALEAHGMPLELRYLPIIESALNPTALSRVGATGLWQFMYYTGKRYGLEVTSYVDDRRDPAKATEAACLFLRDLYGIYGDWHLAIAAYNCGPGNVNRAIARSGGKKTFWEIYYNLPRETRGYVPAFIAAAYAMNYAAQHKIFPSDDALAIQPTDTVVVYQPLHFNQVTSVLGVPVDVIRSLNPQFKHDVVPATEDKVYPLVLPVDASFSFAAHEDTVYARDRMTYFPDNKIVPISEVKGRVVYAGVTPKGMVKLVYTVKNGDVPGAICKRFGVRLADLNYWNNIRKNMIRVGQKLVIYVPKNKADKYAGMAKVVK